jgi:hypothetical protein
MSRKGERYSQILRTIEEEVRGCARRRLRMARDESDVYMNLAISGVCIQELEVTRNDTSTDTI